MKKYIKHDSVIERQNDDGSISFLPFDPANTDYREYLAWVAEGNTAEEWNQGE